jgi:hypothetical protein
LRLPIDLTLRTVGCNGISNAWYHRHDVSVGYEYLNEIYQTMPMAAFGFEHAFTNRISARIKYAHRSRQPDPEPHL